MPANYFLIYDTQTGLWLKTYSTDLPQCTWGYSIEALHFDTQALADAAINSWSGGSQGGRFIGKNPPPR